MKPSPLWCLWVDKWRFNWRSAEWNITEVKRYSGLMRHRPSRCQRTAALNFHNWNVCVRCKCLTFPRATFSVEPTVAKSPEAGDRVSLFQHRWQKQKQMALRGRKTQTKHKVEAVGARAAAAAAAAEAAAAMVFLLDSLQRGQTGKVRERDGGGVSFLWAARFRLYDVTSGYFQQVLVFD